MSQTDETGEKQPFKVTHQWRLVGMQLQSVEDYSNSAGKVGMFKREGWPYERRRVFPFDHARSL